MLVVGGVVAEVRAGHKMAKKKRLTWRGDSKGHRKKNLARGGSGIVRTKKIKKKQVNTHPLKWD